MKTIGLIGNPNCGKTTVYNGLTGSHQHIGNWPGVTVEKKEGDFALPKAGDVKIVDLPGIYSLTAASEDEKASLEYVLSHEADLYINVIDATAIERNLYLTFHNIFAHTNNFDIHISLYCSICAWEHFVIFTERNVSFC